MDLSPSSLSQKIPIEVINLIIQESDAFSTLKAWCLVSKGSLSIAVPLLMREVVLRRPQDITPFLHNRFQSVRSTQASSSSRSPSSSLIHQHLSTNHTRFLDLLVRPSFILGLFPDQALEERPSRPRLTLSMSVRESGEDDLDILISWVPTVLRWLQPGRFAEVDRGGTLIIAYSPSLTSDYLDHLSSSDDPGLLDNVSDYMRIRMVQNLEGGAGSVLSMLEKTVGTRRLPNPTLEQLRGAPLGSEYINLKEELELLNGGEPLEQEEVGGRKTRFELRAGRVPRIQRLTQALADAVKKSVEAAESDESLRKEIEDEQDGA